MARFRVVAAGLTAAAALALAAPAGAQTGSITAQPVATGLAFPSMFTFAPDGRIFYTERLTGRVRTFDPATGANTLFHQVNNMCISADQGLFGVALHPGYPVIPWVYVYATRLVNGVCRNQVLRLYPNAAGVLQRQAIWGYDYTGEHNGGRIQFGPDSRLYVSTGDGEVPANAQSLSHPSGKILRMTDRGKPANGNPFKSSRVWASGFRNVFGFDFDPQGGRLWATENGPECNDELDRIVKGGNYGWGPSATCTSPPDPPANTNRDGASPIMPALFYSPSDGPTGAAFCQGCGLGADTEGKLLYGAWRLGQIRRVTLSADRTAVASQTVVYTHSKREAPLSIETGPGGAVYFSDNNTIYRLALSP